MSTTKKINRRELEQDEFIERLGARVAGYGFLVELSFLGGRKKLEGDGVFSLVQYE